MAAGLGLIAPGRPCDYSPPIPVDGEAVASIGPGRYRIRQSSGERRPRNPRSAAVAGGAQGDPGQRDHPDPEGGAPTRWRPLQAGRAEAEPVLRGDGSGRISPRLRPPANILGTSCRPPCSRISRTGNGTIRTDTRHIEDCMMYYGIANRVAGTGETWIGSAASSTGSCGRSSWCRPARWVRASSVRPIARPYDVLLRGMATEAEGVWAERAWLFMAMCRQLGSIPACSPTPGVTRSSRSWRPSVSKATR